jgi:hypothetical protein
MKVKGYMYLQMKKPVGMLTGIFRYFEIIILYCKKFKKMTPLQDQ